eukprot:TRINITY_DN5311_c0_g1_i2.p1 TRINITY_DN5311_c0_g1~~TRINITY_DN5311_c0_g1_i2.p1  ORF type:complete len:556 (+),score=100.35 TRINITY_DN5311_c0_g1_i2:90-1757(+)
MPVILQRPHRWTASVRYFQRLYHKEWSRGTEGRHHVMPNVASHTAAIRVQLKGYHWQSALELFASLHTVRLQPDAGAVIAGARAWGQGAHWLRSLQLLAPMLGRRSDDPEIDDHSRRSQRQVALSVAVTACGRAWQWPQALDLLLDAKRCSLQPSAVVVSATMTACERGSRWDVSLQLFSKLLELQRPDLVAFGAAISSCVQGHLWQEALGFLEELQSMRLAASNAACGAALAACEAARQWPQALWLLKSMDSQGLSPDVAAMSSAISSCEKAARWIEALLLLREDMPRRSLEPNVVTLAAACSACEKATMWEQALALLAATSLVFAKPNSIMLNALISACEKGSVWESALSLLDTMPDRALRPDVISYNACLSACEHGNRWTEALALIEHMDKDGLGRQGLLANAALLRTCERSSNLTGAEVALKSIRQGLCHELLQGPVNRSACDELVSTAALVCDHGLNVRAIRGGNCAEMDLRILNRRLRRPVLYELGGKVCDLASDLTADEVTAYSQITDSDLLRCVDSFGSAGTRLALMMLAPVAAVKLLCRLQLRRRF